MNRRFPFRRALSGLLALVLLWAALPALGQTKYGVVTGDRVLFRKATSGSDYWDHLDQGWIAQVLEEEVKAGGHTWFKVEANTPTAPKRTYTGYIRSDYFRLLTEAEQSAWLAGGKPQPYLPLTGEGVPGPEAQPAPAEDTAAGTAKATKTAPPLTGEYGLVTVAGANLRDQPGGVSLSAFPVDTLVQLLAFPAANSPWYQVRVGGMEGYLAQNQVRALSPTELAAYQAGTLDKALAPVQVVEQSPEQMAAAAIQEEKAVQAPVGEDAQVITNQEAAGQTGGTLRITKTSTNLRKEPGGTSLFQYTIGTELPFVGAPVFYGGYHWAKVEDSRRKLSGYVRSDCYEVVTGTPVDTRPVTPPTTGTAQVRITLGGVNLRQTPGGAVIAVLDRNRVLPFFGSPTQQHGYSWVYVYDDLSQQHGYVRSDCYEIISGAPTQPQAPQPQAPSVGSLTITKGGVNLRNAPAGLTIAQLDRGLEMNYSAVTLQAGYTWYQVNSPKGPGWLRSDVVSVKEGTIVPPETPATPEPGSLGYLVTTKTAINLRKTASNSGLVIGRVDIGQVLAITGPIKSANGYSWFEVKAAGVTGYLRGDCVRQLNDQEITAWLNNGTLPGLQPSLPNLPDQASGYVVTTLTSVNVRATASLSARTLGQIDNAGVAFPMLGTLTSGGQLWYKISYQGQEAFLLGKVARQMSAQEYQDYLDKQSPSPTPAPTPTPPPEDMSQTAITTMSSVIIRSAPGSNSRNLAIIYRQGTVVALRGETGKVGTETWYAVRASGINGWIRGDLLRVLTKLEEQMLRDTGDPDAPKPASYRTLSLGITGEDVTRLQNELIRRGLFTGSATGTYDSGTAEAVKAFQRANKLTVDGIAGSQTQHKLYGTVPEDTYTPGGGSTVTPTLYPVELVDWYKGDINTFWGRGETAVLTDVASGISLRVRRWAGGYHVDGEPLTSADTAALARIYGVKTAQDILERNLYQRRPVWITLKGRSFAASLYGVPHNYPDGDTIPNNDFNGQLCVHFYNSRVHTSGNVDANHMKAIQRAYDVAPSRK